MSVGYGKTIARSFFKQPFKIWRNKYSTEASFETRIYELHRLENGPATTVTVTKDDALRYFKQMQMIRRLETAAGALYKEKLVRGFCHLYSGQEAIAVGMRAVMRDQDSVISGYRIHGWAYLMGVPPLGVLAELTGRRSGCARGKGGSMHMYGPSFYGGNGIVGAQGPLGAGIALAAKYMNTGGVCFTLYGDGAANQGQLFETYNMAKLWKLPCIFVCENNGYGMGTSAERASANTNYYTRGDAVPGIKVDGMDVLAVREASKFAIDYATSGNGPIVLETVTYRYSGHSMSDPGTSYRTREEVQQMRSTRDPISSFKERIVVSGLSNEDDLKIIETEAKSHVDEAVKKAKVDKEIDLEELTTDIYYQPLEPYVRNILPQEPLRNIRLAQAKGAK